MRAGLDVVTDGEMSKVSFLTYVEDRLSGFDGAAGERLRLLLAGTFRPEVHPTVVWEKFRAPAEGARLASARLWPRPRTTSGDNLPA